tara:strand:+ start:220 stop:1890 length:1671 start_codon:yes stop_codon:yes gene_type:complete
LEYQISWLGGSTFIIPRDKGVVKQGIERYITATAREHDTLNIEMNKTLDNIFDSLDVDQEEDFKQILAEIIQEIINNKEISYAFYKKDNVAWSEYLRARTGDKETKENLRRVLDNYAKQTTLYEVFTGSNDYQRMKGFSMFKFGRDMEKTPKFNLEKFLADSKAIIRADSPPLFLEIKVKKSQGTAKNFSLGFTLNKFKKEQKEALKKLGKELSKKKKDELIKLYIETFKVPEMKESEDKKKFEAEILALSRRLNRKMTKESLISALNVYNNSITANPKFSKEIDRALRYSFRILPQKKGETFNVEGRKVENITRVFYALNKRRGYLGASEDFAQALLDTKKEEITSRGVLTGKFVAKKNLKFKEIKKVDFSELSLSNFSLLARPNPKSTLESEQEKPITDFTLEDLVPLSFLNENEEEYSFVAKLRTSALIEELTEEPDIIADLRRGLEPIENIKVNLLELKFSLPSASDVGTSKAGGNFAAAMRALKERLKEIKIKGSFLSAEKAEFDANPYGSGGQNISEQMENHIDLMKERLEDLEDFDIEIRGQADDMEED